MAALITHKILANKHAHIFWLIYFLTNLQSLIQMTTKQVI